MERRGSGMGGMMPFFPGPGIGDQPPLAPTDMPPFPHMRERFPNAIWAGEGPPQGQWPPSFHAPGVPHPAMGHPAHPPPHQFNQFEPRQPMFNFAGGPGAPSAPTPSVPVSQYNQPQYNGQFTTSTDATTGGYVPQGHFSPQTTVSSVPAFTNPTGPPNGYITHSQGNGLMGGSSPHHHHQYQGSNEFQQQQQQHQMQQQGGGMFKSPLPSPAISAPESSPVTGGFTMTTLPSPHAPHTPYTNPDTPHASEHPNEKPGYLPPPPTQNSLDSRVSPAGGYSGPSSEGGNGVTVGMSVSVPQSSPHGHVQSRLKNMIMSRQGGSGFQGSGGGPVDSPPLGEIHFSGSVSAVTSPVDAEPQQMHESIKMSQQNFLAYRTTGSGPDPVVHQNNTHEEGGVNVAMASTTINNITAKKTASTVSSGRTSPKTTNSCSKSSMHSVESEPKKIIKDYGIQRISDKANKKYDAEAHSNIDPKPPDECTKQIECISDNNKLGGMFVSKSSANPNIVKSSSNSLSNMGRSRTQQFSANVRTVHSGITSSIATSTLSETEPGALSGSHSNLPTQQDFRLGRDRGAGFQRPVCADVMGAKAWPHGQQPPTRFQLSSTVGGGLRPRGPSAPAFQNPTPIHSLNTPSSQLSSIPQTQQQHNKIGVSAKNGISSIRMQQMQNMNLQSQPNTSNSVQQQGKLNQHECQNLVKQKEQEHSMETLQSQSSSSQTNHDQKLFLYHQEKQRIMQQQQHQLVLQNQQFQHQQIKQESTDIEVQRQVQQIHQTMRMKLQKQDELKMQAMQTNEIKQEASCIQPAKNQVQQPIQLKQEPEELKHFDNLKNQHSPGQQQFQMFLEKQSLSQQDEIKKEQARKQEFERQEELKFKQRQGELEKQRKLFETEQKIRRERDKEQQRLYQKQREEIEKRMQMNKQNIKQEPNLNNEQPLKQRMIKQEPGLYENSFIKREPYSAPGQTQSNPRNFQSGVHQIRHPSNQFASASRQPGPLDHLKQLGVPKVSNNIHPKSPNLAFAPQVKQEAEKRPAEEPGEDTIRARIRELERTNPVEALKEKMRLNETLVPECNCNIPTGIMDPGPIYTHLGYGHTLPELRQKLEKQIGHCGKALRVEKVRYTGLEGKTDGGCPLPKWIIRRSGIDEKALVVVKQRPYHVCKASWIVIAFVAWEGIPLTVSDNLYSNLVYKLNRYGNATERRCGTNDERTCICQGLDPDSCGASYSFGCSWSMYYNACKFARSKFTRKFRLTDESEENDLENRLDGLATYLSPLYKKYCPDSFANMCSLESDSTECRLGQGTAGRPWSGVTACMDFCAHSHKDNHNINNGCTVVATLTKWRGLGKPPDGDEQLHVLPLYALEPSQETQQRVAAGALEVLNKYPREILLRTEPLLSARAKACLLKGLPLPNPRGRGRGRGAAAFMRGRGRGRGRGRESDFLMNMKMNEITVPATDLNSDDVHTDDLIGVDTDDLLNSEGFDIDDYNWLLDVGPESDLSSYSNLDYLLSDSSDVKPSVISTDEKPSVLGNYSITENQPHQKNSPNDYNSKLSTYSELDNLLSNSSNEKPSITSNDQNLENQVQGDLTQPQQNNSPKELNTSQSPSLSVNQPTASSTSISSSNIPTSSSVTPPEGLRADSPSSGRAVMPPPQSPAPRIPSSPRPCASPVAVTSPSNAVLNTSIGSPLSNLPVTPLSNISAISSPLPSPQATQSPQYPMSPAAPILSPITSIYSPSPNTPSQIPALSPVVSETTVSEAPSILPISNQSLAQDPSREPSTSAPLASQSTFPLSSSSPSQPPLQYSTSDHLTGLPHSPGLATVTAPISTSDEVILSQRLSPHISQLPHLPQSPLSIPVNSPNSTHSIEPVQPAKNRVLSHSLPRSLPGSPLGSSINQTASSVSLPASPLDRSLPSSPKPQTQQNLMLCSKSPTLPISDVNSQAESQLVTSQSPKLEAQKESIQPLQSESTSNFNSSYIKAIQPLQSELNSKLSSLGDKKETIGSPFTVKVEIPGQPPSEIKQEHVQDQSNIKDSLLSNKTSEIGISASDKKQNDTSNTPTTTSAPLAYLPYYPFTPLNRMQGNIPTGPPRPPFSPIYPSVNCIQPRIPQSSFKQTSNSPAPWFPRSGIQEGKNNIENRFQKPLVNGLGINNISNDSKVLNNKTSFEHMQSFNNNELKMGPNMKERYPPQFLHQNSMNISSGSRDNCKFNISEQQSRIHGYNQEIIRKFSDNIENFYDQNIGGIALALTHGSVLFECAKHELHATTALKNPDRRDPKRISLVFYQHKSLIHRQHGMEYFEGRMEKKRNEEIRLINEGKLDPSPRKKKKMKKEGVLFPEDDMQPVSMNGFMKHEPGLNGMSGGNRFHHPNNSHPRFPHHPAFRSPPNGFQNYRHPMFNPRPMPNPIRPTYQPSPFLCSSSYIQGTLDSLDQTMKPQLHKRSDDVPIHMPQPRQMMPMGPSQDIQTSPSINSQVSSPYVSPRQVSPYPSPRQVSPYPSPSQLSPFPSPRQISPYQSPEPGQMHGRISQTSPYLSPNHAVQHSPTQTFQQPSSFQPYHQQTSPTPSLPLHSPKHNFQPQLSPHNSLPPSSPIKHPMQHSPNPMISQHSPNQGSLHPGMIKGSPHIPNQGCGPYHNFMTSQPSFGMTPPYSPGTVGVSIMPSVNPIYSNASTGNS